MAWLDEQTGSVQQYEKVSHTFLNEYTGEMHCDKCNTSQIALPNPGMSFITAMKAWEQFEKFTERHLHGVKI